jgi:hypothetical protein
MNLRECVSNNRYLAKSIPPENRAKETVMEVLGLEWNRQRDTFVIKK